MKKCLVFKKFLLFVVLTVLLTGCVSKRSVTYLQGADQYHDKPFVLPTTYEITIQPDDQLAISISASEKELLEPFTNRVMIGAGSINGGTSVGGGSGTFTVDKSGYIEFPVFGLLKVAGYTRADLARMIESKLKSEGYVLDPVVSVDIKSFKVTILGEAGNTVVNCATDRFTILEALAKAGGINYTGKRHDVLVLREEQGKVSSYRIDVADAKSVLSSPVYYLKQNDVIYIEPNGVARVEGSPFYRYMNATSSIMGFTTSVIGFLLLWKGRLFK